MQYVYAHTHSVAAESDYSTIWTWRCENMLLQAKRSNMHFVWWSECILSLDVMLERSKLRNAIVADPGLVYLCHGEHAADEEAHSGGWLCCYTKAYLLMDVINQCRVSIKRWACGWWEALSGGSGVTKPINAKECDGPSCRVSLDLHVRYRGHAADWDARIFFAHAIVVWALRNQSLLKMWHTFM